MRVRNRLQGTEMRFRRLFALVVISLAIILGADALGPNEIAHAAERRPNVVVIITDDQPLETYSAMQQAFRWLSRTGTEYPHAYVSTPQCCPSRATIMTGLYAHNHGVRDTHSALQLDETETIQYLLQKSGYRTGYFGKYLNSWRTKKNPPFFDDWATHPHANYGKARWNVHGEIVDTHAYNTDFISRRTSRFLEASERRDSQPWMLYMAPDAPHSPFIAERRYDRARVEHWKRAPNMREEDPLIDPTLRADKPEYVKESESQSARGRIVRRKQLRTLMSVNDLVMELRGTLRRLDETRDTLVIFTSDNGYLWGQHGWIGKAVPYTPSIRVPFIIRWPAANGSTPKRDERLVSNVDIAPTVLDAAGISRFSARDGRSLMDSSWERDHALSELWTSERGTVPPWASLRSFNYHYIEYYAPFSGVVTYREFYDLRNDPWQLVNVFGDGDPSNDPPLTLQMQVATDLQRARSCRGTTDVLACP